MPRSVPADDTEQLVCLIVSGWPTASANAGALYSSRKTPPVVRVLTGGDLEDAGDAELANLHGWQG